MGVGVRENDPLPGHAVEERRLHLRIAGIANRVGAQRVDGDEDDVGLPGAELQPRALAVTVAGGEQGQDSGGSEQEALRHPRLNCERATATGDRTGNGSGPVRPRISSRCGRR